MIRPQFQEGDLEEDQRGDWWKNMKIVGVRENDPEDRVRWRWMVWCGHLKTPDENSWKGKKSKTTDLPVCNSASVFWSLLKWDDHKSQLHHTTVFWCYFSWHFSNSNSEQSIFYHFIIIVIRFNFSTTIDLSVFTADSPHCALQVSAGKW